jgi:hypothetical protein
MESRVTRNPHNAKPRYELAVSSYDRVSSLLIALLALVGLGVAGLVVIIYTSRVFARQEPIPVEMEQLAGRGDNSLGLERDPEPLGVEDVPALQEPQLQDALAAVSDAVADSQARLDDATFDGAPQSSRGGGRGDSRAAGGDAEGIEEKVPRASRWEIHFDVGNLQEYARQLDAFGIELAVLDKSGGVLYAGHFTQSKPERKSKSPELESRLYMSWRGGALQAADRQLLARAGIEVGARIMLQFYPPAAENELALREKEYARGRDVNEIRKTIFGVRRKGNGEDGFEFFVIDQRYFE